MERRQTTDDLCHSPKEWIGGYCHAPAQGRHRRIGHVPIESDPALREAHEIGTWLQPEAIEHRAGFLLRRDPRVGGVDQADEFLHLRDTTSHPHRGGSPVELDEWIQNRFVVLRSCFGTRADYL